MGTFSSASLSINTWHQFTLNGTRERAFLPRTDHFCTKIVGLCCQLCYLSSFVLNSVNKHKNQNVLFQATFLLILLQLSEWFHLAQLMSLNTKTLAELIKGKTHNCLHSEGTNSLQYICLECYSMVLALWRAQWFALMWF